MNTVRTIALLALCASNVGVAQSEAPANSPDEVYEEVVVMATNSCGLWAFPHRWLDGCSYMELNRKDIAMVRDLRSQLLTTCLNCEGNRCTPNEWSRSELEERLICRRLFFTPENVSSLIFRIRHSSPLSATINFTISTTGDVDDIEIVSFDGDIAGNELLELIERGARKTRFLPLIVDDIAYEIAGMQSSWVIVDDES